MVTKWKIKGIEGYRFGEDKNLYKLPFKTNKRYYDVRLIKEQYGNRWKINGKWHSKRQIKSKLIPDDNPIELFKELNEYPF